MASECPDASIPPADCGLLAVGRKLVPVSEDLFGFLYLLIQTGKVELHFPGSSGDQHLNGRQTAPLHSRVELLVNFLNSVVLETIHG